MSKLQSHLANVRSLELYPEPRLDWQKYFNYWGLAQAWSEAGWSPEEAYRWKEATKDLFMTPVEALAWKEAGFGPDEAAKWAKNWNPKAAADRKAAGYTPRRVTTRTMKTR